MTACSAVVLLILQLAPASVDVLITGGTVVTVDGERRVLEAEKAAR
jgi:hypothetical protein